MPVPNGTYTVLVKFWDDPTSTSSGDLIYSDQQDVTVTNGILNIAIPDSTTEAGALDPAQFAQPLWVEFTINGQTLSPRQKLLGTPYAFTLVGGSIISLVSGQEQPLIDYHPERGALTITNSYASSETGSPGTTGLVVGILDITDSEAIRVCAGGTSCTSSYLIFRVQGNGDVRAKGSFFSGGADYAELVRYDGSPTDVEAGDVLIISPASDRAVIKSSGANDSRLAGVYSTKPGYLGGSSADDDPEGYIPVAMMGIVPVKVTASNGAIQRGDLLTTSEIPGYAMKATDPQPGAILGKAMGELESGEGVIEVYLLPH